MKTVKLTLIREGGPDQAVDLRVSAEAEVDVGALAGALADRDPRGRQAGSGRLTLALDTPEGVRALPADAPVDRCGLRSGSVLRLLPDSAYYPDRDGDREVAVLEVRSGPDAGRKFPLRRGWNTVGRDRICDVRLSDPQVSKLHAKIVVSDVVEIIDTNSSNGVEVGGGPVPSARLRAEDTALLGETVVAVFTHGLLLAGEHGTRTQIDFNRSPRLDPGYAGVEREAPELPKRQRGRRFPVVSVVTTLAAGAAMYLLTHSTFVLMFVALAPLMAIGAFVEDLTTSRRDYRRALDDYQAALAAFTAELHTAAEQQQAVRRAAHPHTTALLAAAAGLTPLVWTRRRDLPGFLDLRLGTARMPSLDTVTLPRSTGVDAELIRTQAELVAPYRTVDDVPVVCALAEVGAVGVAGHGGSAVPVAWGLVAQLVTLHSPAELVVTAVMSSTSARWWDWLKWLPHTSSPHTALHVPHLTAGGDASARLIGDLNDLVDQRTAHRSGNEQSDRLNPAVLLIVADDTEVDRQWLVDLAERGPSCGVHVLWVAAAVERLPAACKTFVEVGEHGGRTGSVQTGLVVEPVLLEPVTAEQVAELARRLAPVVDTGARVDDETDLPRSVSFVTLANAAVDSSTDAVLDRWQESGSLPGAVDEGARREMTLRALVGATGSDEPFHLDLRSQGPHALVGGTTGAGKSELLQSWILGMATAYSPHRVTFLFVDYKGGSAFGACKDLPHSVGLVTDLDEHLVRRALTSLRAELTYREKILNQHRAKDLAELEGVLDSAPPRLVIVVDEFAALKKEIPEFVDGVVDIAQRGRSLGLHLILATQRPAGVITDNLRANTNLRVALRMADEGDSTDVLGSAVAAGFDPAVPGRAVARTGPGRLVTFQAAYAGGWTGAAVPTIRIDSLEFGPGHEWSPRQHTGVTVDPGPNDIARVVDTVSRAAVAARLPAPRRPWRAALDAVIDLAAVLADRPDPHWLDAQAGPPVPIGLRDRPGDQEQPPALFYPDRDGNLVVFGTGGSGKSTLLRTVALAAVSTDAGPCHVYGVEFGTRGLAPLVDLPHVGSIIRGDDAERVSRLFDELRVIIDERATRYARQRSATITEYRRATGTHTDARILLLIDGMGPFHQQYAPGSLSAVYEKLLAIATDGRQVGVHLIVSADRPNAIPGGLASALQSRVVLRLAVDQDYAALGLRPDVLAADACPGRGLIGPDEVQIAVLGGAAANAEADPSGVLASGVLASREHDGIRAIARLACPVPAPEIRSLPERQSLSELPVTADGLAVIGIDRASLRPVCLPAAGTFLVAGPASSGRSTALTTIVRAVLRRRPDARLYYLGAKSRSAVADLPVFSGRAQGPDEVAGLADRLAGGVVELPTSPGGPPVVLVVEAVPEFGYGSAADLALQRLLKVAVEAGHLVIGEGEIGAMSRTAPLSDIIRSARTGILLQPQPMHAMALQCDLPRGTRQGDFPIGSGALITRGSPEFVQLAVPD